MTRNDFWDIIARVNAKAGSSFDGRLKGLRAELMKLTPDEIYAFDMHYLALRDEAYRWDLWGAAYILGEGCSDDGFMDFRAWLISMGRQTYDRALADPESLAAVKFGPGHEEASFFEMFSYVARKTYEEKTGEEMPFPDDYKHPPKPAGERWSEDGDDLAKRFPKLWAKHGD